MELMVLRLDDPSVISTALAEVRRRAEALGLAWRLVSALSARSDLAAELGLRAHEVAKVHKDDIHHDLFGLALTVRGKGGKDRPMPLSDDLAREVRLLAAGGWLLPGRIDGHLSGPYLGKLVARALPGVWTMHTLRHRFGTLAAEEGDLIAVQRLLGHASVATTQRYVLRPDGALRRAARHAA